MYMYRWNTVSHWFCCICHTFRVSDLYKFDSHRSIVTLCGQNEKFNRILMCLMFDFSAFLSRKSLPFPQISSGFGLQMQIEKVWTLNRRLFASSKIRRRRIFCVQFYLNEFQKKREKNKTSASMRIYNSK